MIGKVVIEGELIALNQYIDKERGKRRGWAVASRIKKTETERCSTAFIKMIGKGLKISASQFPLNFVFRWYVPNARKDKDNIVFAKKFIFDGMVKSGLIPNDGWKEIGEFRDICYVDADNPRIEVEIYGKSEVDT